MNGEAGNIIHSSRIHIPTGEMLTCETYSTELVKEWLVSTLLTLGKMFPGMDMRVAIYIHE